MAGKVGEAADVEKANGEILRGTLALPGAEAEPTLGVVPRLGVASGADVGSFSFSLEVLVGEIIILLLLLIFLSEILFELFLRLKTSVRDFLEEMRCNEAAGPRGLVSPVRLTISVVICASSKDTKPSLNHDYKQYIGQLFLSTKFILRLKKQINIQDYRT